MRLPLRSAVPWLVAGAVVLTTLVTAGRPVHGAAEPLPRLTIVAPAARNGGWDQTARAMKRALEREGLVRDVQVVNSPGAGGAIGLAQFVSAARGNAEALLVGGHVMLGAIRLNQATVSLLDATPIARLAGEHVALVVAADSPFRMLDDLVQAMRSNAVPLTWAGGSAGGTEHALATALAASVGIPAERVMYLAFPGGSAPIDAVLDRKADVGAIGYGEVRAHVSSGALRALAVSSAERLPDTPVPTLREGGVAVAMENWRGVFAPPGITGAQRARLEAIVSAMVETETWQFALREQRWADRFLDGPPFALFLQEQHAGGAASPARVPIVNLLARVSRESAASRGFLAMAGAAAVLLVACALLWRARAGGSEDPRLQGDIIARRGGSSDPPDDAATAVTPLDPEIDGRTLPVPPPTLEDEIDQEFAKWGLTAAEREVALLMLKGFRHKEIAGLRATSERTVRQQAASVYRKAGVNGRAEFAAYFFEDRLSPALA